MPPRATNLLDRVIDRAPPVVRERIIPFLRIHVRQRLAPAARHTVRFMALYVVLQVMLSQSTGVQTTWNGIKRLTPRPVRRVFVAAGDTGPGRVVMSATFAIRHGADWIFHPVRAVHARQEQRGQDAGKGIIEMKRTIDDAHNALQGTPTVDEMMHRIETAPPPR